ncbi:biopolymer transporter ExbB [Marinovum sp. 2_MG-2023]|uniref:biopolymer transporter ExbB n=1 Tax=Roseobacteraceae TaxID=2854170 RepID=UPI001FD62293|nr:MULTISPECIES: biopolymer transporter ExbB [unclassified Marinovum]MCJ7871253.1 biopolymer transporter ExbB [Phaeobacter sp. J2-8]MDO6732326.1 biopolymer transporter ExbB [Marinovum sp. 2_MG-2023]MDO6781643.1 biopolymer transporter ExbB [Marinovum sp. 1_MG-2023]
MDKPDREAEPKFSQPVRQVIFMVTVLGLVGAGLFLALPRVLPVFLSNPYLNGFIVLVFVIGVFATFWQVVTLIGSVRWIESFAAERDAGHVAPRILAPLATLMRTRGKRMQISATSSRSILDSVGQRIDEAREITRYIVSLLIFLGLLGTFYGLATTIPALVDTIRSLTPAPGETGGQIFERLQQGLQSQLGGMGTAFASSLLGLAGSLVVGLLELFAGHGQNRFYRELEEWMSSITRLGYAGSGEGEGGSDQQLLVAVVDHMSEQMESLQQMFAQSDESRAVVDDKLSILADSLERMTERLEAQSAPTTALTRLAEGQERLIEALESRTVNPEGGIDAESRMRLRSIDVQMLRILEEMSAGRQESMAELRTDLSALTRALNTAVRQVSANTNAANRPNRNIRRPKLESPEQEG